MKSGVGTSHICLCMTAFLNACGIKTLCMDMTNTQDLRRLFIGQYLNKTSMHNNANSQKIINSNGIYYLNGAYLLPDYHESIKIGSKKEYQIIIMDSGTINDVQDACADDVDLKIIISTEKYNMIEELQLNMMISRNLE